MLITDCSIIMAAISGCVLLLFGVVLSSNRSFIMHYGISGFLIIMAVGVARLLVPVELKVSKEVPDTIIMPALQRFFRIELFSLQSTTVNVGMAFVAVWIMGSAVYLALFVGDFIRQSKAVASIPSKPTDRFASIMDEKVIVSSKRKKYRLIVADGMMPPVMTGLFVPTIILPDMGFTDEQAYYILRHEWLHYLSGDLWKKFFVNLLCAFFWWNPLMYVLKHKLNYMLEIDCDRHVLKNCSDDDRIKYVEMTLSVIRRMKAANTPLPSNAVFFAESASSSIVVQRCELALYPPKGLSKFARAAATATLAMLVILSYIFMIQPHTDAPPYEEGMVEISPENAFLCDNGDGTYSMYYSDANNGTIFAGNSQESNLVMPPYCDLTIKKGVNQ
jgi:beta-lactamase regulating signal transducer with metallopeptidase domain